MSGSTGARIARLQYLRGIAAASVAIYHASYYLNAIRHEPSLLAVFGDPFGNFGVSLFFAISGFLMAELAQRDTPATLFLAHRIVRIYPIYWIIAGLCLWGRYMLNDGAVFDPLAFGLIPGGPHYYLLGVEWTLPFELTYYFIIFLLILAGGRGFVPLLALIWLAATSWGLLYALHLQRGQFPTLFLIPFAEKSLAFAAGLLVPWAIRRGLIGAWTPIIGMAMLALSGALPAARPWLFNIGCVLLVAAAVFPPGERAGPANPGVALGDWSFALYLCHVPIVIWLYRYFPPTVPPFAAWLAAVGAAFCGAVAFGKLDMALYATLKRRVDRASPRFHAALAVTFSAILLALGSGLR